MNQPERSKEHVAPDTVRRPVALVTGANKGIGFGVARQLASEGYRVIVTARDVERGRKALARLRETQELPDGAGGKRSDGIGGAGNGNGSANSGADAAERFEFRQLDVADPAAIGRLATSLSADEQKLDVLVNNAAVALDGFDANIARRTIDTNFYGPIRVMDALRPLVRTGGRIVMVSSGAGELSNLSSDLAGRFMKEGLTRDELFELIEKFVRDVAAGRHSEAGWPTSCYSVSKCGLNAFVRISASGLAEQGIAINAVCPGWVRTDMGGSGASRSIEEGAESVMFAARISDGSTGGFYRDGSPIPW